MPRRPVPAAGLLILLLASSLCGCATSRRITTRSELAGLRGQPITVYVQGDRMLRLERYSLVDSTLEGQGTEWQPGREPAAFVGALSFDRIIAVEARTHSVAKTLALAGITVLLVAQVSDAAEGTAAGLVAVEGLRLVGPPSYGGTSCPYAYAWDGTGYELQAEPFGVAWGRALELTTSHLLPAARPDGGRIRLRLANERQETHHVNSLRLRAIELGAAPAAVLDVEGTPWPLARPEPPRAARDRAGRDVRADLAAVDGRSWECAVPDLAAGSGYEDVLELAFPRPRSGDRGSLVVTAVNTGLSTVVYGQLCRLAGGHAALLAHAVETDPELIASLRGYLRDASLEASVWDGRRWASAGTFVPEAVAVTFTRALRIRMPEGCGDTVRVRLRSLADVWRIDAVSVDWSEARPLPATPLRLLTAAGPGGEDLRGSLAGDDDRYAILLPPDRVELVFDAPRRAARARFAYALDGRGYLLEWAPPRAGREADPGAASPRAGIALVKEVLKHRDLALAPVYESWRQARSR